MDSLIETDGKNLEEFIASLLKPLGIALKKQILKDGYPIYSMETASSNTIVRLNSSNNIGRSAWTLLQDMLLDIHRFNEFSYLDNQRMKFLASNPYCRVGSLDEMKIIRDML